MKAFSLLQNVQRQIHFNSVSLFLHLKQSSLQIRPKVDLLKDSASAEISVQLGQLVDVKQASNETYKLRKVKE